MDSKETSDQSVASAQQVPNVNHRDLPALERFFIKIGLFNEAFTRL
jgi:hypothetical protein